MERADAGKGRLYKRLNYAKMSAVITARPILLTGTTPLLRRYFGARESLSVRARFAWLAVALCCTAVLTLAAILRPDPRGLGTHEAFGMPPCGFLFNTGLPCPTCGMTTAFAYLMHGHPYRAFLAQPSGVVLCMGTIALLLYSFNAACRGWISVPNFDRVRPVRFALTICFVLLAGWAFKLLHGLATGALPIQ